jgi:hypothetical protein
MPRGAVAWPAASEKLDIGLISSRGLYSCGSMVPLDAVARGKSGSSSFHSIGFLPTSAGLPRLAPWSYLES